MNAPWYHPNEIDWTDGLNPLAKPAYAEQNNPFVYAAMQHPTMVAIRNTPGLVTGLYAAPDQSSPLGANATVDAVVEIPAESWIYGISASSQQPEGFLAQITMPSGVNLFSRPVKSVDLQGANPFYLRPQGIPEAGPVKLRLVNLSAAANLAQLTVWVVQRA